VSKLIRAQIRYESHQIDLVHGSESTFVRRTVYKLANTAEHDAGTGYGETARYPTITSFK
jgi:hypothetical protein